MKICMGPMDATPDAAEEVGLEDIVVIDENFANQTLLGNISDIIYCCVPG